MNNINKILSILFSQLLNSLFKISKTAYFCKKNIFFMRQKLGDLFTHKVSMKPEKSF